MPSDHEISTERQFWQTVEAGAAGGAAPAGWWCSASSPSQPETGYGYIEVAGAGDGVCDVSRFVEKPDLATAKAYLAAGNFYWNTGIFLFRASAMRDAFAEFQPEIWQATEAAYKAATSTRCPGLYMPLDLYDADPVDLDRLCDHGARRAASPWCRPASAGTISAPGSRCSMSSPSDKHGNVIVGDVVAIDCENSYIRSDGRLLSAIGMKDVAIVSTADATFVAPVSHSQHVKKIVEQLEKSRPAGDQVHAGA